MVAADCLAAGADHSGLVLRLYPRIAARVGQGVAFLFIGVGLFSLLMRNDFGGLWIAFIGWFLLEGALAYYVQAQLSTTLQGVRVADVMARECATAPWLITPVC